MITFSILFLHPPSILFKRVFHPTPRNYGLQGGPFYQYIFWTSPYTPLDPEPLPEGSALKRGMVDRKVVRLQRR